MWNSALELFKSYMGTGLITVFFLVMVVYLYFIETDKAKRILFVYMPMGLLVLYFNPLFCNLVYGFIGDEIYYRILWLMPVTIVLSYGIVNLYKRYQGKHRRIMMVFLIAGVMLSGSLIYANENFKKAENEYHIPQTVVEICDAIEVEGREVMAVFPMEMLQYVRQYSAYVCMPYGREMTIDRWGFYSELCLVMEADVIVVEKLAELAKEDGCHYIIIKNDKELLGNMGKYDYELFAQIGGYDIYIDRSIYIGL